MTASSLKKALSTALEEVDTAKLEALRAVADEVEEYLGEMPDAFLDGTKGVAWSAVLDTINDAADSLEQELDQANADADCTIEEINFAEL